MKTIIISAFPACGKSYATEHLNNMGYKAIDSDSSKFSWIKDEHGNNTEVRNPRFLQDYMNHIRKNIGKVNFIFVSSHKDVRQALEDNEWDYTIVYPNEDMKNEWVGRCFNRGNTVDFCNLISKNFENWIDEIRRECFTSTFRTGVIVLNKDTPYLISAINVIETHIGNY